MLKISYLFRGAQIKICNMNKYHQKISSIKILFFISILFWGFTSEAQKIYVTEIESWADIKVYVTDIESWADLKIHFTDVESWAGWKKKEKMHLLE